MDSSQSESEVSSEDDVEEEGQEEEKVVTAQQSVPRRSPRKISKVKYHVDVADSVYICTISG